MRRRIFALSSLLSLLLCLYCAWYGMSLYVLWRHGYIADNSEVIVHDAQLGRRGVDYMLAAIPLTSLPIAWFFLRLQKAYRDIQFRERWHPGLCKNCFYELHGNTSGVCPECGTAIH